jgi:hypothetical protein
MVRIRALAYNPYQPLNITIRLADALTPPRVPMTKTSFSLSVESFDIAGDAVLVRVGQGTACFEICKTDPTSDPEVETCGPLGCD